LTCCWARGGVRNFAHGAGAESMLAV
jgi:hypothetical protein